MSLDAGINASRPNGKRSRGPVTSEGKAISSKNRINHGLFINSALLPGEDKKELRKVLAREFLEHEPESPIENRIVQKLALYQWKQMRLWAMQIGGHAGEIRNREGAHFDILSRDMAPRACVACKESHGDRRCTELLHRCEVSYLRQYRFLKPELIALRAGQNESISERT